VDGIDFVSTIQFADIINAAQAGMTTHPYFLGRIRPCHGA